jgi:1-acyl-sn-glycerol-3-phosphate acyltransferase
MNRSAETGRESHAATQTSVRAHARVVLRAAALIVWTALLSSIRMLAYVLAPVSRRAEEWCRRLLFRIWAGGAMRIIGMKLDVEGEPPRPPYFLVTNHLTYVDILVLARTAGCAFVSRADLQSLAVLGLLARMMNTIFIDRAKVRDTARVNDIINRVLDRGYGVHVFAESRISQDAQVHPFKPPLLEPAVRRGMPVYYAAISYATPPGCPRARDIIVWKEGVGLAENMLNVLRLPGFRAIIRFGDAPIRAEERKELAGRLFNAVRERFVPVD